MWHEIKPMPPYFVWGPGGGDPDDPPQFASTEGVTINYAPSSLRLKPSAKKSTYPTAPDAPVSEVCLHD